MPTFLSTLGAIVLGAMVLPLIVFAVVPITWSILFARAEVRRHHDKSELPAWDDLPLPTAGRDIVILIHGTFATGAPWTLANSPLAQALQGHAPVTRFRWSGANSMRSRRLASEGLRTCIATLASQGFEHITLVAHSHGGNIALKACEQLETAAHVRAIVCLATPFISAWAPRARIVPSGVRAGIVVLIAVVSLLLPPVFGLPSYFALIDRLPRTAAWTDGGLLLSYLGVAVALGWGVARQFSAPPATAAPHQDIAGSVCDPVAIAPLAERTLVVTTGGDEADGVLKIASAINRSLVAGANWRPTRPGEARATLEQIDGGPLEQRVIRAWLAALGHVAVSVTTLAFGVDARTVGTSVFLTSSEIPAGTWHHWHVDAAERPDDGVIAHSSLYDDPRVIERLVSWVGSRRSQVL